MENKQQPLVSVNVLMYNSSKYILETLESIKAQTYQNIELIMSDDKSTDNTVQICEDWIAQNKDRFVSYKILVPEHNTGQSGNYNRAFHAASGEWIKEIDGDDLLLPDCVEECVKYILCNSNAIYVFSKIIVFGASKERNESVSKNLYDYSFFQLDREQQIERLIFKGNCIPSSTAFYNKKVVIEHNIEYDERIPYVEDLPRWLNVLRSGITLHFIDKELAKYRLCDTGISTNVVSYKYFCSLRKMYFLYQHDARIKHNEQKALQMLYDDEISLYRSLYNAYCEAISIKQSKSYRFGKFIFRPLTWVKEKLYSISKM